MSGVADLRSLLLLTLLLLLGGVIGGPLMAFCLGQLPCELYAHLPCTQLSSLHGDASCTRRSNSQLQHQAERLGSCHEALPTVHSRSSCILAEHISVTIQAEERHLTVGKRLSTLEQGMRGLSSH